jgi:hypothetical protein
MSMYTYTSMSEIDNARSLLDKVLETQQQIADSFIVKRCDEIRYYGWFSEEVQASRMGNQTEHKIRMNIANANANTNANANANRTTIKSPPYTYWLQGKKKILVTDVTLTDEVMTRHKETNAIFLGKLDKFCCRSYTKL